MLILVDKMDTHQAHWTVMLQPLVGASLGSLPNRDSRQVLLTALLLLD